MSNFALATWVLLCVCRWPRLRQPRSRTLRAAEEDRRWAAEEKQEI